jgi:hypothetical protein
MPSCGQCKKKKCPLFGRLITPIKPDGTEVPSQLSTQINDPFDPSSGDPFEMVCGGYTNVNWLTLTVSQCGIDKSQTGSLVGTLLSDSLIKKIPPPLTLTYIPANHPPVDPFPDLPALTPPVDPFPNLPTINYSVDTFPNLPAITPPVDPFPDLPVTSNPADYLPDLSAVWNDLLFT